ncbi:MAG TPA: DUF3352 domain-containing protein [Chloroflexia bacterium]|nr:DUF3352 domain-containing protein [Chloroflexia bacterium]
MDGERAGESGYTPAGERHRGARPARPGGRLHPAVVAAGAVLVIALAVGAVWGYRTFLARPAVGIERLLPASTMAYFSFDASPEGSQGEAAARIRQAFEAQPGFREAWERITRPLADALDQAEQERPSAPTFGVRPEEPVRATPAPGGPVDLTQYLGGNVTLALLPLGSEDLQKLRGASLGTGAGEPEAEVFEVLGRNVVALVDLDFDALSKRGLLSDLKRRAEQPQQVAAAERHRDVDIRRFDTGSSVVYFALLDGASTAVVGAAPDPIRAVIDTYRDNRGLSGSITHAALVREVPAERLASVYVNLTEIYRALRLADPEAANSGPVRDLRGGVLLTLGTYEGGLQLDVASEADVTFLPSSDIDDDGRGGIALNPDARPDVTTLSDVPPDAHGLLVGTDLRTPLEQLLRVASQNPASDIAAGLREFEADTGLDLAADVAPLLSGDYVLSARLEEAGGALSPSVVFELKMQDEARARAVLDRLAAGGRATRTETIAGAEFHVAGDGLAFGTVARRAWVAWEGDGEGAAESLAQAIDGMGKGITSTEEWRERAKPLPRYSNVIAHVDMGAVREAAEASPDIVRDREAYERDVAPFLRPLKYVLVGSASYAPERALLSRNHTVVFVGVGE